MAYVAIPNVSVPISQNSYNSSYTPSKYNYRSRRSNYVETNPKRIYENALGSWDNISSALSCYTTYHLDLQNRTGSNWRNPLRASRRSSHSVDIVPSLISQNNYPISSNYKLKYSNMSANSKRAGSQSHFEPALSTSLSKYLSTGRAPCYGVTKHLSKFGSTSSLYKYSPHLDSSAFNSRPHHWRSSRPFQNSPQDSFIGEGPSKDANAVPCIPSIQLDHSIDILPNDDEFQKDDIIKNRYQIVQEIGRGSFGRVYKAMDSETGKMCAIKCIRDIANFRKLANDEISVLSYLTEQDQNDEYNFLHLNDHFSTQDHIFIVSDLLSVNLFQLIHRNNYRGFSPHLVRKFVRCILNCLHFIHKNKIIHCDLKPENILLERPGYTSVKVIDFGSSCHFGENVYSYIQSRFYRAPEVIFGCEYEAPIDMWSLGCIVAELLTGSPLFPGKDDQDQIACIMEVLGLPPASVMRKIRRPHHFFTDDGEPRYLSERAKRPKQQVHHQGRQMNRADPGALTLEMLMKNSLGEDGTDPKLLDFLYQCLRWDPVERIAAREALRHPWILDEEISVLDNAPVSSKGDSNPPPER